jgi:hypothetical protein
MTESEYMNPKTTRTTLSRTEKNSHSQQTGTARSTERSIKERSVRPRQHLPPRSLGKQQRARTVHITLTLNKIHTQFPVGTSKKRPPGDSQRPRQRNIAQGTKVPHDGLAEVPVRINAGRHKGVTRVQMARMRRVCAPVTQSYSGALCVGGSGNVGRAARMNHGDIQQGETMGWGKGHLVSTRLLTANRCTANRSVTGLRTCIASRAGWVSMRVAAAEAIAAHGVVDIATLDVTTTETSGDGDIRVGASSAELEVATVVGSRSERQRYRLTGTVSR